MSSSELNSEIRPLSADEIEAAAGAMHIHVPGVFHLAIGAHGASIGAFGVGVGVDDEGAFTFTFE